MVSAGKTWPASSYLHRGAYPGFLIDRSNPYVSDAPLNMLTLVSIACARYLNRLSDFDEKSRFRHLIKSSEPAKVSVTQLYRDDFASSEQHCSL
jgi:hypothetical protein